MARVEFGGIGLSSGAIIVGVNWWVGSKCFVGCSMYVFVISIQFSLLHQDEKANVSIVFD